MSLEEISRELYRALQGMIEKRTDKNPRINEEIDPRIKQRSIQIIPNHQITITKERYRKQQTKRKIYIVFFISEKMSGGSSAWQSFRISPSWADGDAVDASPRGCVIPACQAYRNRSVAGEL